MSAVDRAAEIIDNGRITRISSRDIAQRQADVGLLVTDEAQAVLDAAGSWDAKRERWNAAPLDDDSLLDEMTAADAELRSAIAAYIASRASDG